MPRISQRQLAAELALQVRDTARREAGSLQALQATVVRFEQHPDIKGPQAKRFIEIMEKLFSSIDDYSDRCAELLCDCNGKCARCEEYLQDCECGESKTYESVEGVVCPHCAALLECELIDLDLTDEEIQQNLVALQCDQCHKYFYASWNMQTTWVSYADIDVGKRDLEEAESE